MSGLVDDNPATKDLLGFAPTGDILAEVVRHPPRLPFTLGIFGAWGSGKTTMMQMIRDRLVAEGFKTVWFNAWKYDSKEVIWNALIQRIFWEMRNDSEVTAREDGDRFRERVGTAAKGLATYAAKVATRLVPGGIVREEDVDHLVATLTTSATDETYDFINRFEQHFDELVKEYVGDGHLVVFIDDLDRCLPENAVNVMEALKLYLDRANCIFVIGAESGVIEQGIAQRYGASSRLPAEDYLDKIIQVPFVLPAADESSMRALLDVAEEYPVLRSDQMRTLVRSATGGNPRRVKRFMNLFWVLAHIGGDLAEADQLRLGKVLMIQLRFPQLFRRLARDLTLAQSLSDAVISGPVALAARTRDAPPAERELLENADLVRFLQETSAISVKDSEIRRWVLLTSAHAPLLDLEEPAAA